MSTVISNVHDIKPKSLDLREFFQQNTLVLRDWQCDVGSKQNYFWIFYFKIFKNDFPTYTFSNNRNFILTVSLVCKGGVLLKEKFIVYIIVYKFCENISCIGPKHNLVL